MISYQLNEEGVRPWGKWQVIGVGKGYIVKKLQILPKASLSLQMHHYRAEHWVVVKGKAHVQVGEKEFDLTKGMVVDIPKKTKHQLENLSNQPLEVIEVQMGKILNEEDIVRFKDLYNRVEKGY
ncbi:MAG: phosphomannose isomerase type II C-terminal cupin domain [Alphaproteobacteria bacterium]|nr:phosphomannose isomerase type II C-terminal cupin domain [Alphaproteobacteria bacterium]